MASVQIPPDWLVFEGRLYGLRSEPASVVNRTIHVDRVGPGSSMTFEEFENSVVPVKGEPDLDEVGLLLYQSNAMAGEAGEVSNVVKKAVRDRPLRSVTDVNLLDECGDVLFYMHRLLLRRGLSIEGAAESLIAKLARQRAEKEALRA